MGQIDDQIVFPLLCLPGCPGVPESLFPGQIQLDGDVLQGIRQLDGLLAGAGQLLRCGGYHVQLFDGLGDEIETDDHPADEYREDADENDIFFDPLKKVIDQ